jgi:hypothetical protein
MSHGRVTHLMAALLALLALLGAAAAAPPARAQAPARVALLHAVPLAEPSTVTVAVDGAGAPAPLASFGYGEQRPFADVAAGERRFSLYAGALTAGQLPGATPLLTAAARLEAGKDYIAVATGGANGLPLTLLVLPNDPAPPPQGSARVRVLHAAPFAASPAAVDVVDERGQAVPGLLNIAYGRASGFAALAGNVIYDLRVVPTGRPTAPPLINPLPRSFAPGELLTMVAVGGANGRQAELIDMRLLPRGPARLRVVHAAPFAGPASPVNVTVGARRIWADLGFGTITPLETLDEGLYTLNVEQPGDPPGVLATTQVQLRRDTDYLALIRPSASGQGLEIVVQPELPDGPLPGRRQGLLVVYHVAPFDTGARGRVDLRDQRNELVAPNAGDLPFGQRVRLELREREYDLRITTAGGATVLAEIAPFTLQAGGVATIFVIDGVGGRPASALLLADPVEARVYLPFTRR